MDVYIIYSDPKQIQNYDLLETWNLIDEGSAKTKKKAKALKGAVAAKLNPVVVIKDNERFMKVFYKEEFKDPIHEFIKWYYAN